MYKNLNIIFFFATLFSAPVFSISCRTLAEHNIPAVQFTSIMQLDFRAWLQEDKLLEFDDLSDFSQKFIGTKVTQKRIDVAISQAFETFGLKFREDVEKKGKKFESQYIEDVVQKEAKIKFLLISAVKKFSHGL